MKILSLSFSKLLSDKDKWKLFSGFYKWGIGIHLVEKIQTSGTPHSVSGIYVNLECIINNNMIQKQKPLLSTCKLFTSCFRSCWRLNPKSVLTWDSIIFKNRKLLLVCSMVRNIEISWKLPKLASKKFKFVYWFPPIKFEAMPDVLP